MVNANAPEEVDESARAAVDDDAGVSFPSALVPAVVAVAAVVVVVLEHAACLVIFGLLLVVPSGAIVPFPGVRRSVAVSALASARVPLPRSCHGLNSYIEKISKTKKNPKQRTSFAFLRARRTSSCEAPVIPRGAVLVWWRDHVLSTPALPQRD